MTSSWHPLVGWMKINFDIAFWPAFFMVGAIDRNDVVDLLFASYRSFDSFDWWNPSCPSGPQVGSAPPTHFCFVKRRLVPSHRSSQPAHNHLLGFFKFSTCLGFFFINRYINYSVYNFTYCHWTTYCKWDGPINIHSHFAWIFSLGSKDGFGPSVSLS